MLVSVVGSLLCYGCERNKAASAVDAAPPDAVATPLRDGGSTIEAASPKVRDASGDLSTETTTIAVADFCRAFSDAIIAYRIRCFGGSPDSWASFALTPTGCGSIAKAIDVGRVAYVPQKAAECLVRYSTKACNDSAQSLDQTCLDALVGQVSPGETCFGLTFESWRGSFIDECVPGSGCSWQGDESCRGTCRAIARAGDVCSNDYSGPLCAPGFRCVGSAAPTTYHCVEEVGEGQSCTGLAWGNCADGLFCEGSTLTNQGICRARKTSGPCVAEHLECAFGYACLPSGAAVADSGAPGGTGADAGVATVCTAEKLTGQSCTPGRYECFSECGTDGVCSEGGIEGRACGLPDFSGTGLAEFSTCALGLACIPDKSGGSTGTCKPQVAQGQPCEPEFWIFRPACAGTPTARGYCDRTTHKCAVCE